METDNKKLCAMCGEFKDKSEFYYWKKGKRYNAYCNECRRAYNRAYGRARYELKHEYMLEMHKKDRERKKGKWKNEKIRFNRRNDSRN